MDLLLFFLAGVIAILIVYIVARENIYKNELKELENENYEAETKASDYYNKLYKIQDLIIAEEKIPVPNRNSYTLIRKIKEVITSDETK